MEKVILKLDLRFGLITQGWVAVAKANEPKSIGSGKPRVCAGNKMWPICDGDSLRYSWKGKLKSYCRLSESLR